MWNAEREADLRRYWAEGLSQSQIAALMGLPGPSAVAGKVNRLGLARRRAASGWDAPKLRRKHVKAQKPAQEPRPPRVAVERPPTIKVEPAPPMPATADVATVLSVMDLEPHHCRWPVGDPVQGFCGCRAIEGRSYCPGHASRAYVPPAPRKPSTWVDRSSRVFT